MYRWNLWFILPLIIGAVIAAVMKHPSVIVRPLTLLFAVALAEIMGLIDYTYKSREGSDWPVRPVTHPPARLCESCAYRARYMHALLPAARTAEHPACSGLLRRSVYLPRIPP